MILMSFSSSFVRLLISSVLAIRISGGREDSAACSDVMFKAASRLLLLLDMLSCLVFCAEGRRCEALRWAKTGGEQEARRDLISNLMKHQHINDRLIDEYYADDNDRVD